MTLNTKKIVFIVGPTAIGKTKLSIQLAKKLRTEIISCDSRQFYKELKIGTAAPNKQELSEVKHHFIHNLSVNEDYNAGKFESDAINLIEELHQIHDTIIAVGGSGLYIDAICKGFDQIPRISKRTRALVNSKYQKKGLNWLQKQVKNIDPELYSNYDIYNPQRLLRALEVYRETGKNLSSFKSHKIKSRPFKIIKIGLKSERNILYDHINKRVELMIEDGLVEEVNSLLKLQSKNALQTVGYTEIFAFLNNKYPLETAIKKIKRNTRRFAKRQITWFRKDKDIRWFTSNQLTKIQKLISES